ncbi:MAG: transcription factor S [Candidatus Nanoarchaeia archaeon]
MMFCPECGSIMKPNKEGIMVCGCGYEQQKGNNTKLTESMKGGKDVDVVEEEFDPSPEIDAECPKCKNNKAKFWTVQTRASDEPETKFFKCTKCGYTWRDYD